jgi:hypothetical protein
MPTKSKSRYVAQAEAEAAKQEVVKAEVGKEVAVAKGKQDAEVAIKQAAAEVQKVAVDAADDTKAKTEAAKRKLLQFFGMGATEGRMRLRCRRG